MARMTKQMANLLLDQMSKVLDFSSQLHPENTKRQQHYDLWLRSFQMFSNNFHDPLARVLNQLAVTVELINFTLMPGQYTHDGLALGT